MNLLGKGATRKGLLHEQIPARKSSQRGRVVGGKKEKRL